jgi:(R,R)-butanediol dehydrogenase/meso-butanediol dehydrogenase/diacetyl reductase
VYHGPGDVRVETVPDAPEPGPGEVLLEVLRASICGTDVGEYFHGPTLVPLQAPHPVSGHAGPMILGHEILGRVLAVGSDVTQLAPRDRVVPGAGIWCGRCSFCRTGVPNLCDTYHTVGLHRDGGLAEYVTVPAEMCLPVAERCADDHAVMAQPLAVALHAIGRGDLHPGEVAAVVGAGGIGAMVIAGASTLGLGGIVAIDVAAERLEVAATLGATALVDASGRDPVPAVRELTGGEGAHVVFEASGTAAGLATAISTVRRGGRLVLIGLQAEPQALDLRRLLLEEVDVITSMAHVCNTDLPRALRLLEEAELGAAMLDRVIDLGDVVDGLVALADGSARGKIVVKTSA